MVDKVIVGLAFVSSIWIEQAFPQRLPSKRRPTPAQVQTVMNISRLDKSITLDKTRYFPGEAFTCEITIRNPTAEPIVVQAPFSMPVVYLAKKTLRDSTGMSHYEKMMADLSPGVSPFGASITFEPGQSVQRTYYSLDESAWRDALVPYYVPDEPGEYRLVLDYDPRVFSTFEIVAPTFVMHREIAIPKEVAVRSNVSGLPAKRYVAVVLESSDGQYLCEMADARMSNIPKPGSSSKHNPWQGFVCPQKLSGPVSDLALNMGESGKVTVVWREAVDGQIQTQRREVKLQALKTAER
jgi:hypothetical protein